MKFLPTCLPSGLTVAAPDAFGRIPGVDMIFPSSFKSMVLIEGDVLYYANSFDVLCRKMLNWIALEKRHIPRTYALVAT